MQNSVQAQSLFVILMTSHALLGKKLPSHYKIPERWWNIGCAATIWQIWKVRCIRYLEHKPSSALIIWSKIWHRLKIYLLESWHGYKAEIDMGQLTIYTVQNRMLAHFGNDPLVFGFKGNSLLLSILPPHAP